MSSTIHLEENRSVRLTEQIIEAEPPARVAFAAEGVITITEAVLGEFAGTSLKPIEITLSVDGSETVAIDLSGAASLRLDTVDVGVETPDVDDLSPGMGSNPSSTDGSGSSDAHPGAIAFTVEGVIRDAPAAAFDVIADGSPRLESITFATDDVLRSDGGSGTDVVLEIGLLGYGVVVRRNGTIEISTGLTGVSDVGPL